MKVSKTEVTSLPSLFKDVELRESHTHREEMYIVMPDGSHKKLNKQGLVFPASYVSSHLGEFFREHAAKQFEHQLKKEPIDKFVKDLSQEKLEEIEIWLARNMTNTNEFVMCKVAESLYYITAKDNIRVTFSDFEPVAQDASFCRANLTVWEANPLHKQLIFADKTSYTKNYFKSFYQQYFNHYVSASSGIWSTSSTTTGSGYFGGYVTIPNLTDGGGSGG